MPLAVALLNVSNPEMGPMDMLSRLSHDSDEAVAQNAILALGAHRHVNYTTTCTDQIHRSLLRCGGSDAAPVMKACPSDATVHHGLKHCNKSGNAP